MVKCLTMGVSCFFFSFNPESITEAKLSLFPGDTKPIEYTEKAG